jgi:hypothetical protein
LLIPTGRFGSRLQNAGLNHSGRQLLNLVHQFNRSSRRLDQATSWKPLRDHRTWLLRLTKSRDGEIDARRLPVKEYEANTVGERLLQARHVNALDRQLRLLGEIPGRIIHG